MDPRVRALILCNSFVTNPFALSLRHLAVAPLFAIPLPGFFLRSVLLGRYASSTLLQTAQRAIRRVPSRVVAQRVQEVFRADERAAFRALQKPVFYLRGSEDYLISERSWKRLKEIRPDASIANIKGPHMLLQTFPRECWDAISRFIETGIF